jgi:signal peptidase I
MFRFLYSEQTKARKDAANWLEVAERVHHYRCDQLSATQDQSLHGKVAELQRQLKERADAGRLKLATEALERELRACGGRH